MPSRRPAAPRAYLSRREQRRLLSLVLALGLVIVLMLEARRPERWHWLWTATGTAPPGEATDSSEAVAPSEALARWLDAGREVDTRLEPGAPEPIEPGTFRAPAAVPGDLPGGTSPAIDPALLAAIRDDTMFRPAEFPAWQAMCEAVASLPPAELEAAATSVTFLQLHEQPSAYRGRSVRVHGTVRRAVRVPATASDAPRTHYWQLWLQPADAPTTPLAIYCLELPEGMPSGEAIAEPIAVTGLFVKRWAYLAQDTLRTAPLIVARTVDWSPAPAAVDDAQTLSPWSVVPAALVIATLFVWFAWRRTRPGRGAPRSGAALIVLVATWVGLACGGLACGGIARAAPGESPLSGPREMLELLDLDPDSWPQRVPAATTQEAPEVIVRLLHALRRFPPEALVRWQAAALSPQQVVDDPSAARGELVALRGRLERVERIEPPADVAQRLDLPAYFRCEISAAATGDRVIVFAEAVPAAWFPDDRSAVDAEPPRDEHALAPRDVRDVSDVSDVSDEPPRAERAERAVHGEAAVGQRVSVVGLFALESEAADGTTLPVVAATRVAWHPETLLGDLEMDVGLFDSVRDRSGLSAADRPAFYDVLTAVGRAGTNELVRHAQRALPPGAEASSVVPLYEAPHDERGRLVLLTGTARRAIRIVIDDPAVAAQTGLDHYYELSLFTPDSQGNPLVCCLRELPPGLPEGDNLYEPVRVAAFFFKLWAYESPFALERGPEHRQLAPLLIGRSVVRLPLPETAWNRYAGLVAGVLFVAAVVGLWLIMWRLRRGDDAFHRELVSRRLAPADGAELGDLDEVIELADDTRPGDVQSDGVRPAGLASDDPPP